LALLACATAAHAAGTPPRKPIRVVTFNVFNRPWKRSARIGAQLETLRSLDPDLVALQEVATGWILPGDPIEPLAGPLGLHAVRYWHEENFGIFRTGIAVLSRFELERAEYREFRKHQFWDAKGYLSLTARTPYGPLTVVNLHMASTDDRGIKASEFGELEEYVRGLSAESPVLVLGDFNTERGDPQLESFVRSLGAQSLYSTLPASSLSSTWNDWFDGDCNAQGGPPIDHILLVPPRRGPGRLSFASGRIVIPPMRPMPSDHCPVFAEILVQ
jgi:endonuclease/exonuclease/phosphatase family metal-dependent hydrolase